MDMIEIYVVIFISRLNQLSNMFNSLKSILFVVWCFIATSLSYRHWQTADAALFTARIGLGQVVVKPPLQPGGIHAEFLPGELQVGAAVVQGVGIGGSGEGDAGRAVLVQLVVVFPRQQAGQGVVAGLRVDFDAAGEVWRGQDENVVSAAFDGAHAVGAVTAGAGLRIVLQHVVHAVAHQRQGVSGE